jgi:hypothetical protein
MSLPIGSGYRADTDPGDQSALIQVFRWQSTREHERDFEKSRANFELDVIRGGREDRRP